MIKPFLRQVAGQIAPAITEKLSRRRWIRQDAVEFRERMRRAATLDEKVEIVLHARSFRATQKRSEISSLLNMVRELKPRTLCEIGAFRGGTLALFAAASPDDAQILSLDIDYPLGRDRIYPQFCGPRQSITCLEGDSHLPETADRVRQWLHGREFDFLFIDGDHSWRGVSQDFELYRPFVRRGGLIAFHDIVPDSFSRTGVQTAFSSGDVPAYWNGLKRRFDDWQELIDAPDQDGFGIGVIRVV
jgi:cephalosporin hydroxylase